MTVVFISPGMKEQGKADCKQWIPWEVSYSLKETARRDKNGNPVTSKSNAMIAVVLPDKEGSYTYCLGSCSLCSVNCLNYNIYWLFDIIKSNMFNIKDIRPKECGIGRNVWPNNASYIRAVRWDDFIRNYQHYVEEAIDRRDNIDNYDIKKEVDE